LLGPDRRHLGHRQSDLRATRDSGLGEIPARRVPHRCGRHQSLYRARRRDRLGPLGYRAPDRAGRADCRQCLCAGPSGVALAAPRSFNFMRLRGDWNYPTSVRFGAGRLAELADAVRAAGMARPLFVTDPILAATAMTKNALGLLDAAGIAAQLFAEVRPNPVEANVRAGVAAFRAGGHDGVVALGGGSALD